MNDHRYRPMDRKGQTKKSALVAKPKSKVVVERT